MTTLRQHLDHFEDADELVKITEPVHWDGTVVDVAAEAIRHGNPPLRFTETSGIASATSGIYGAADQFSGTNQTPWSRIAAAIGMDSNCSYSELLGRLADWTPASKIPQNDAEPAATIEDGVDLYDLGLPTTRNGIALVSLGIIAAEVNGTSTWAPIAGNGRRSDELSLSIPQSFAAQVPTKIDASVLLGVPCSALLAAFQAWTQGGSTPAVPELAIGLDNLSVTTVDSRIVPTDAEIRIDGTLSVSDTSQTSADATLFDSTTERPAWELACQTSSSLLTVDSIASRDHPIVPFAPRGTPLTDDIHLLSLVEAAKLFRRVNNYWGVSPVRWIQLPAEGRFGLCIVSSEILYAGFEWQLANTLFSFSDLFDKVLVLDEHADPTDLSRALDDMWVKAHPANDWIFSEPNAPKAAAPVYRDENNTGTRLYINATWDPRWDEEYIAPRVTLDTAFSESVISSLIDRWEELGLENVISADQLTEYEL